VNLRNNYVYKFGLDSEGSDGGHCQSRYRGSAAFSEDETRNLKTFIEGTLLPDLGTVVNLESYGGSGLLVGSANNYDSEAANSEFKSTQLKGFLFVKELEDSFRVQVGNAVDLFGRPNNGDVDDWVANTLSKL